MFTKIKSSVLFCRRGFRFCSLKFSVRYLFYCMPDTMFAQYQYYIHKYDDCQVWRDDVFIFIQCVIQFCAKNKIYLYLSDIFIIFNFFGKSSLRSTYKNKYIHSSFRFGFMFFLFSPCDVFCSCTNIYFIKKKSIVPCSRLIYCYFLY